MSQLLATCQELFGTQNLYDVLALKKEASFAEVKRGYYKISLKVHPDRVEEREKELATKKFQALGKIYGILSDKEKRAVYDETGDVGDDDDELFKQERDWNDYWRILFKKVSVNDIKDFEKDYKGSEEEKADVKAAYLEYEGDMEKIIDNVMCSTIEDEPRFCEILNKSIKAKQLPAFKSFTHETKRSKQTRQAKAKKEAKEAEEYAKEIGLGNSEKDLQAAVRSRQQTRAAHMNDFFSELEAKYAKPKKRGRKS